MNKRKLAEEILIKRGIKFIAPQKRDKNEAKIFVGLLVDAMLSFHEQASKDTYPEKFINWLEWEDDNDDYHFIKDYTTNKWLNADENMKEYSLFELYQYWQTNIKDK